MTPSDIKGAWAHDIATKIIDKNLGWDKDRTQLLREITAAIHETYNIAFAEGEALGFDNTILTVLQKMAIMASRNEKTKETFLEWCKSQMCDEAYLLSKDYES